MSLSACILLILSFGLALSASASDSPLSVPREGVAKYIVAGLGGGGGSSSDSAFHRSSTFLQHSTFKSNSSYATSSVKLSTSISSVSNGSITSSGSGPAYASSCQSALWNWKHSSESYGFSHESPTAVPYTIDWPVSVTYNISDVSASRVITLCDGQPRAVGAASIAKSTRLATTETYYTTTIEVPGSYPTPMPCSIGPSDCANLWSTFASITKNIAYDNTDVPEPPCATSGTIVPFVTDICSVLPNEQGGDLPAPWVVAQAARLLYWPVRTVNGTDYLCSRSTDLPQTVPGTRTGSGPNVFVTGNLTITSPTVGISFSGLSRIDGCGPTIDHTIFTAAPGQVSSVRGARAEFDILPFNYADLNWNCQVSDNSSSFTIQNTQGPNCYQDVQAAAYFESNPRFDELDDVWAGFSPNLTMVNDYLPTIVPPLLVSDLITSLWGKSAFWFVDGMLT